LDEVEWKHKFEFCPYTCDDSQGCQITKYNCSQLISTPVHDYRHEFTLVGVYNIFLTLIPHQFVATLLSTLATSAAEHTRGAKT
jgi:hypothetical protein